MINKKRAFTLIELMIVVALISVLVAALFPRIQNIIGKGNEVVFCIAASREYTNTLEAAQILSDVPFRDTINITGAEMVIDLNNALGDEFRAAWTTDQNETIAGGRFSVRLDLISGATLGINTTEDLYFPQTVRNITLEIPVGISKNDLAGIGFTSGECELIGNRKYRGSNIKKIIPKTMGLRNLNTV